MDAAVAAKNWSKLNLLLNQASDNEAKLFYERYPNGLPEYQKYLNIKYPRLLNDRYLSK